MTHAAPVAPDSPTVPARPAKKPVRWGRLAAVAAAALAAGLWFAPALAARSGLRHTVVHRIFPGLNADVTVGRAEFSWLSPATLRDLAVSPRSSAASGAEPLLRVAEVRTDRPLHALLAAALFPGDEPADFGAVTLVDPHLRVALRPGGSDLEDLLSPLLAGDSDGPSPGFVLAVEGGAVTFIDAAGRRSEGRDLTGSVRVPSGSPRPDNAKWTGGWGDGERSGTFAVTFSPAKAEAEAEAGEPLPDSANQWTLRVDDVPLTAAAPLLTRWSGAGGEMDSGAAWAVDGVVGGTLDGRLSADGWTAAGRFNGARLTARRADWPAGDRLRLTTATLSGGASGAGSELRANRLAFASDLLDLSAHGPLPTAVPADAAALLTADRRLSGRVDVAALAAQLPGLLHVADGATIEAGTFTLSAGTSAAPAASVAPGARRLTVAADLAGLRAALAGGERVEPEGPIAARLEATRDAAGTVIVDRLAARADGLTAIGRGTADDLTADVTADLAAFDRTFGRLLDLGGRWSGAAEGAVRLRRPAPNRLTVRAGAVGRQLRFTPAAGGDPIEEEEVTTTAGVDLLRDGAGDWSAMLTGLRADAGDDMLTIVPRNAGRLSLTLRGELATLVPRVAAFASLPNVSADGGLRASAVLRPDGAAWEVEDGRAEFRRLKV